MSLVFPKYSGKDRKERRRKPDVVFPTSLGRHCQKGNIVKGLQQRINIRNKFQACYSVI